MINTQILYSSAMLSAIYEKKGQSIVDLLVPICQYCIFENYKPGEKLDKTRIKNNLQEKLGLNSFPINVIESILKKIKNKGGLSINPHDQSLIVLKTFSDVSDNIKKRHLAAVETVDRIISKAMLFLNNKGDWTEEDIKQAFYQILILDGFNMLGKNIYNPSINDRLQYNIALFLKESLEDNDLVSDLRQIMMGLMINNSIFIKTDIKQKNIKDLHIFFDTALLLQSLELMDDYSNNKTKDLLSYCSKNASVYYFSHCLEELRGILQSHINGKHNNMPMYRPLAKLSGIGATGIENILSTLEERLATKGIQLYDTLHIDYVQDICLGDDCLSSYLTTRMKFSTDAQLTNDINSVNIIKELRERKRVKNVSTIESSKYIFVSDNHRLVENVNMFFKCQCQQDVGYIISDVDLTTVFWIKNPSEQKNLPFSMLLGNACAFMENLSISLLPKVEEIIARLEKDSTFDSDVARIIREKDYIQREIIKKADYDPEKLTQEVVDYSQKYREKIISEENEKRLELETKLDDEYNRKINYFSDKAEKYASSLYRLIISVGIATLVLLFVVPLALGIGQISAMISNHEYTIGILWFSISATIVIFEIFLFLFKIFGKFQKALQKKSNHLKWVKYKKMMEEFAGEKTEK